MCILIQVRETLILDYNANTNSTVALTYILFEVWWALLDS